MTGDRRRVVFVSQRFPPEKGGNAARLHDTATHLEDQGWSVTVLAPPPCYPPSEFDPSHERSTTEEVDGVTVHRLWTWQPQVENPGMARRLPYYLLFGIHAMVWLLANVRRYDAVVTSTPPISTGAPGLLASLLGKAWMVDVRDLWIDASVSLGYVEEGSLVERVSRRFQRAVLSTADRISVTTPSVGESLRETYGQDLREKIVVVPNGVDTEWFRPGWADDGYDLDAEGGIETDLVAEGGAELDTGDETQPIPRTDHSTAANGGTAAATGSDAPATDGGAPVIVYTGNLGAAQDLEACIRSMEHLSHETAILRLVGNGDVESQLKALTADLGLEDRVEFAGVVPREEVPGILAEATVGVAPLEQSEVLSYAVPTKVYEYMAAGLPAVVTGRGEIERIVQESGGGVHAPNDPEAIADRIDELLDDRERRREMGIRGRRHVVEHYDRGEIARRVSDELAGIVDGRESA